MTSTVSKNTISKPNFTRNDKKSDMNLELNEIGDKFIELWTNAFNQKGARDKQTFITFQRVRIPEDEAMDIDEYLMDEFLATKENVFKFHMYLIRYLMKKNLTLKDISILYFSRTFENWFRQQLNRNKKFKNSKESEDSQSTNNPDSPNSGSSLNITTEILNEAFDLVADKSFVFLFSSFNKIYRFDDNTELLKDKIHNSIMLDENIKDIDKFKMINEMKLNDLYEINYEKLVVPWTIEEKTNLIDEFVNFNEKSLIAVVDLCNQLCNVNTNLKDVAAKYGLKKTRNFTASKIAKYATSCLKRAKKQNLIQTYEGISYQLKLSQLRFLITSRYNQTEPISFNGWVELITELISGNKQLIQMLFHEIIVYHRDPYSGYYFTRLFGVEHLSNLPVSSQEFYENNLKALNIDIDSYFKIIEEKNMNNYYYPTSLPDEKIKFVDNEKDFIEMLDFFEKENPDVIGLDCEWRPTFGSEEDESCGLNTSLNNNDVKKRANTLQIGTRNKTFILESKYFLDSVDDKHIDRFGDLVLFSENLIKLGYGFQQDAKKLSHTFPKYKHKFSDFADDVINIDEVVQQLEKRTKFFVDNDNQDLRIKSKGLSRLTQRCFGKPLNKSECMSDWENNPLRKEQLRYAALDAYVLIQIHDYIQKRIKELNIEFDYVSKRAYF